MDVLVTGATGYIGGSVAAKLVAAGHNVTGLVRSDEKAAPLSQAGIRPLLGTLWDLTLIADAARRHDVVVNAADSDQSLAAIALIEALAGSGKALVHTSGSSVVADRAAGEYGAAVFDEDTPFEPLPERLLRVEVDRRVLASAREGIRSVVIRPSLIYGRGRGLNPHSLQLPQLIALARAEGVAKHVGRGLNVWSHVHIDDVVDLFVRAIEGAPAGSLFYAENGEASWRDMAAAVARMLDLPGPQDWPLEDALKRWGIGALTSYGSNSRVSSRRARSILGWVPKGAGLFEEIAQGCYPASVGADPSPHVKGG